MKRIIRLTESKLNRIIKDSIKRVLFEGEKWIGNYNRSNFDKLTQMANQMNGRCSFSLNNVDFTLSPTQRGYNLSSGINDLNYDALSIDSALSAAWKFSNNTL